MTPEDFSFRVIYVLAAIRGQRRDSMRKRNLYVGLSFVATLAVLGAGSTWLERKAWFTPASTMAPRFEVDPMWPKPLPNHWILGQTIGVSVDAQDHIWIIHRAGSLEAGRAARHHESADRAVLRARAAGARIRSGGQSDRPLGRPGPGLRLAGFEPRHHGRLQRQRVDRRQRPRPASGRGALDGPDEEPPRPHAAPVDTSTTTWS